MVSGFYSHQFAPDTFRVWLGASFLLVGGNRTVELRDMVE